MSGVVKIGSPNPFSARPEPHTSISDRALRRELPGVAEVLIENLLARVAIETLSRAQILEIAQHCRLSEASLRQIQDSLFGKAYRAFIADARFTTEERTFLGHLRQLLDVGEDFVIRLETEIARPIYSTAITQALQRGDRPTDWRDRLQELGENLGLSFAIRKELYLAQTGPLLQTKFNQLVAEHRISPGAFVAFVADAKAIGIEPSFDDSTQSLLRRYALLWRIENGELPRVDATIQLHAGETCHLATDAEWLDLRRSGSNPAYYAGISVRVARGVWYRVGRQLPRSVGEVSTVTVDVGRFFLTTERAIFQGQSRAFTIRLPALLGFRVFADALVLEKGTGKHPHLRLPEDDAEVAAVLLSALLHTPSNA